MQNLLTRKLIAEFLGATDEFATPTMAALAIGLALTLTHFIDIPIANASVNPARSTSQALFVGDWALEQLWLFRGAPLLGGGPGGGVRRIALAEP